MREWLKEARTKNGLTMKEMGDALAISESYYCKIEKGDKQRDMDLSLVDRISKALDIPLKKILIEEEKLRRRGDL